MGRGSRVECRGLWVEGTEGKIHISQNLAENVDYTERHLVEGGAIVSVFQ